MNMNGATDYNQNGEKVYIVFMKIEGAYKIHQEWFATLSQIRKAVFFLAHDYMKRFSQMKGLTFSGCLKSAWNDITKIIYCYD